MRQPSSGRHKRTGNRMNQRARSPLRIGVTLFVTLATLAHLGWQHVNGGVASHHLLHSADLPSISNGWSLLVLPALTWYLVGRAQRRIAPRDGVGGAATGARTVVVGFAASLLMGVALSVSFTLGLESLTSAVFLSIVVLGVLLPAYRAECVLGFVLGMAVTFGAVLPTLVGSVIAAVSAAVHLYVLPVQIRIWQRLKGRRSSAS